MAEKDIKLGTAATNAPEVDPKTDMTRYYYRPGTTEPELRPEVAQAEAEAAAKKDQAKTAEQPKPADRPIDRQGAA